MRTAAPRPLGVLAAFGLVGAGLGALWSEVVWSAPVGVVQQGRWFPLDERALAMQTGGTSTYVAIAAVGGLVLGVLAGLVAARAELLVLGAVVLGSAVAAYLMWQVGTLLGPPDPVGAARGAVDGTRLPGELTVEGSTPFLSLPVAALTGLAAVFLSAPGAGHRKSTSRTPEDG